jgi:hypothetical protein
MLAHNDDLSVTAVLRRSDEYIYGRYSSHFEKIEKQPAAATKNVLTAN